ncbi:hypothetical protein POM88_029154 [Heracleum sosnowskyi]|uniref:F-box domain-containing protein n=1 Tax=Heracleum sosnowskyi TaxID=360622 RepID=A0AAD8MH00_9APIA|nr:hypothetical protein POM88_029154 [Heracleum sosnowskyi]
MARVKFHLPEELVMEILYWLPVLSLLQFKSVCKLWKSIITDPTFIKTHSYRSQIMANEKASLLLLTNCQFSRRHRSSPDFNYYLVEPNGCIVIGLCDGIICLTDDKFFHLFNPATKQGKRLPIFPKSTEKAMRGAYPSVTQAFGFDAISGDYKILKFICPTVPTNVVPVVQLYSTKPGTWKEIYVHDASVSEVLRYLHLQLGPTVLIKGALYMGHRRQLLSFDVHSEMFSVVEFPSSMLRYSAVLDFEGSVAVISKSVGEGSGISLWTLDDTRGEVSWTKKFVVRNDLGWVHSYLGGGLLYARMPWARDRSGRNSVTIVHACTKKKAKLPVRKLSAVLKYRETLVSIEGFKPARKMFPWFNPGFKQV